MSPLGIGALNEVLLLFGALAFARNLAQFARMFGLTSAFNVIVMLLLVGVR